MQAVVSSIFKLPASAYMKVLFPLYLQRKWYIFAVLVLPFAALSFVNLNFLLVALMVVFLVVPMLLGYAYFYYALSEECISSIRRSFIEVSEFGITRHFVDEDDCSCGDMSFEWSLFDAFEIDVNGIYLHVRKKKLSFLLIPRAAFVQAGDWDRVVAMAEKNINSNI